MPSTAPRPFRSTVCPHDCPSTCALEVEVLDRARIGAVRGAADNSYTQGVICAKVARYAERVHHPGRLTRPLIRTGTSVESVTRENGTVVVVTDQGDRLEADEILFATGRRPRTGDIGLDTVGLEPGGWLPVDDKRDKREIAPGQIGLDLEGVVA